MKKPVIAIVGRPNVGKSTFFNAIAGRRISIVKDEPGVTRDRIYADAEWSGHAFTMIDTGGIDVKSEDEFQKGIAKQAEIAIDFADVILFITDGREGLIPQDREIADYLRRFKTPVILVVNKIDNNEIEKTYEFYSLGLGEPMAISSEQSKGLGDLLDKAISFFPTKIDPITMHEDQRIKIAIVGRPNAGKSSLVNKLLGHERAMVSEVSGTTRDSIDSPFRYNKKDYILVDTAGIRRKRGIESKSVELFSVIRSFEAIRQADVVILVIDSEEGLTEQDVRIAGFINDEGKPSVILMNKWDLVEKDENTINVYGDKLKEDLKFMSYFVPLYVSNLTGQRINRVMEEVERVHKNASFRIPTGALNEIIQKAVMVNAPPMRKNRRLKIYYLTQAQTNPPTFLLFVNDRELMHFSYIRYLENSIRASVDFSGVPIRIVLKSKERED